MSNQIKALPHVTNPPLCIERDYDAAGNEVIVIEGVRYAADYFREFSHPETNVLYQVARVEDVVCLTVVETCEQAAEFFDEVEND